MSTSSHPSSSPAQEAVGGGARSPLDPMAEALARLGLQRPFLLGVGTLEPRKNHATLLSALELLRSARPDVTLVLAGRRGWRPHCRGKYVRREADL